MTTETEMSEGRLHAWGLFGTLRGEEVPFLNIGRAGAFGVPVDHISAWRVNVPAGVEEVFGYNAPKKDIILIPRSVVSDLARWEWYVTFEGKEYGVESVRAGKFIIWTNNSVEAYLSDEWEGSDPREGWYRRIDPRDLPVRAERHALEVRG